MGETDLCALVDSIPRDPVLQFSNRKNFWDFCLCWKSRLGSFLAWEISWNQVCDLAIMEMMTSKWWATPASKTFGRCWSTLQSWVQITNEYGTTVSFVQLQLFTPENYLEAASATSTNVQGQWFLQLLIFLAVLQNEVGDTTERFVTIWDFRCSHFLVYSTMRILFARKCSR